MNNRTVMHNLTIPVYTIYSIHKLHRKRNSSDSMNGYGKAQYCDYNLQE